MVQQPKRVVPLVLIEQLLVSCVVLLLYPRVELLPLRGKVPSPLGNGLKFWREARVVPLELAERSRRLFRPRVVICAHQCRLK